MNGAEFVVMDLLEMRTNSQWEALVGNIIKGKCVFVSDGRRAWGMWVPLLDRVMQLAVLPGLPEGVLVERREGQECVRWEIVVGDKRARAMVLCQGARGGDFMASSDGTVSAFMEAVISSIKGRGRVCGMVLAGKAEDFDAEFMELVKGVMKEEGLRRWRVEPMRDSGVLSYWLVREDGARFQIGHFLVGGKNGCA